MSGVLILMYHRFADVETDPFALAVGPTRFEQHVEHLVRLRAVVPLGEVRQRARAPRIVVTADDGYADNAQVAAPLLAAAGLPVTWFITAGRLGGRHFWWDRLTCALLGSHALPDAVEVELPGAPVWLDLRTAQSRARALNLLHHRIRPMPPDELEATVDEVVTLLGDPPLPRDNSSMTVDQLIWMSTLPGAEIGAHTLTHVQLRGQSPQLQHREIMGSVRQLGELTGQRITSFAYPFGSPRAVDRGARRLVEEAGCQFACSTNPGLAGPRRDRFLLPRLAVGNWTSAEFAARIRAAFQQAS